MIKIFGYLNYLVIIDYLVAYLSSYLFFHDKAMEQNN